LESEVNDTEKAKTSILNFLGKNWKLIIFNFLNIFIRN
jgi:hypothetical protein